jgi:ribosomal protein S18 acetylase RimI-like enzyme
MTEARVSENHDQSGIFAELVWEFQGLIFLIRNLWHSRTLEDMPEARLADISIRGMKPSEMPSVDQLQHQLRNGKRWNRWRRLLYRMRGRRLVAVAVDHQQELLGFQMFYFRQGECGQRIIHSAFTGVKPEHQGDGIGTRIRIQALRCFMKAGLAGASMYVREDNKCSMLSAERAGYHRSQRHEDGDKSLLIKRFDSHFQ